MAPISILFPATTPVLLGQSSDYSADLRLDQVEATIMATRGEYNLEGVFFTPLTTADEVRFRQEIFHDVERRGLKSKIADFAEGMQTVRRLLSGLEKLSTHRQRQAWLLDAAGIYCDAVDALVVGLEAAVVESRGLRAIRERVSAYVVSDGYVALRGDAARVHEALHGVRYSLNVEANSVTVSRYEGDGDYSLEVLRAFERFRQRHDTEPTPVRAASTYMNHVDAAVLDFVAQLHPEVFSMVDVFCITHSGFVEETVALFDREIQFYVAVCEFLEQLTAAGLPLCYPEVTDQVKAIDARDVYDIALADKLVREQRPVVLNDVILAEGERIVVVTGANQGGKTTFARMFGQLHHLAALGCPAPGTQVRVGLFDRIFTHFERTEDLTTLSGKLEDELVRIQRVLGEATGRSVVVMNESFASTSFHDARLLGTAIVERLIDLDVRAVYVTFVDEIASLGPTVVSMVSTVAGDDPSRRTFKVLRQPADGLAYAVCLAELHGLTARQLKERIGA